MKPPWGGGGRDSNFNQDSKPIIIAGNGPSLTRIDYARLPQDFHVYRCNQFYFEDKYYLGKRVESVFFNPAVFLQQYYTLKNLEARGEYEFINIYRSKMLWGSEDFRVNPFFNMVFPDAIELYSIMHKCPKIHAFLKYNDLYCNQRATSGVLMLLTAAINGYKEIHLIGIDFYENEDYAFDIKKNNMLFLVPEFSKRVKAEIHTKNFDLEAINFIAKHFNLTLYDLSLDTNHALNLPKSPIVNSGFVLEDKPKDSIRDIMIPNIDNPIFCSDINEESLMRDIHRRVHSNTFKRLYLDMKRAIKKFLWFVRK